MKRRLRAGTRPSPLAIKQLEEVEALLPSVGFERVAIRTKGDADKRTPLSEIEGTDFFTREIEDALLSGKIDVAVHSAKDLEEEMPEGIAIAAMTRSISPYESLVSSGRDTLKTLPSGSVIGTSSAKRKEAVLKYRSDLVVRDIRGNIEERLRQLDEGLFDAVIVAHAALIRLGYEYRIAQVIPTDIIEPHPLQGRITVQVRKERKDLIKIFRSIDER